MESPTGTIPSWQLEQVERSLDLLTMLHLGLIRLLEFQVISMESPSGTILFLQAQSQPLSQLVTQEVL